MSAISKQDADEATKLSTYQTHDLTIEQGSSSVHDEESKDRNFKKSSMVAALVFLLVIGSAFFNQGNGEAQPVEQQLAPSPRLGDCMCKITLYDDDDKEWFGTNQNQVVNCNLSGRSCYKEIRLSSDLDNDIKQIKVENCDANVMMKKVGDMNIAYTDYVDSQTKWMTAGTTWWTRGIEVALIDVQFTNPKC